jgi:hypothetical protein
MRMSVRVNIVVARQTRYHWLLQPSFANAELICLPHHAPPLLSSLYSRLWLRPIDFISSYPVSMFLIDDSQ